MTKANIKSDTKIKEFQALQIKVQKIVVQRAGMEEDLGDIPDDFKGKQRQHKTSETRWVRVYQSNDVWKFIVFLAKYLCKVIITENKNHFNLCLVTHETLEIKQTTLLFSS